MNCKNIKKIISRLFLIGLLLLVFPSINPAQQPCFLTQWPHELGDIAPDPKLVRGILPNGLRYIIKQNNEPENRVAIYLDIQAGAFQENDEQRGVAHFLEHMMFNGTENFSTGSLIEYFQSIGMDFGNDVNAHTSYNETVYHLILPDGSKEHLQKGLLVMADYARGALLLESEIDRERGVILAEKRARDSASYRTRVASSAFAFRGTRIPERRVIGTDEVLEKADRKLLKSYYDGWYRPDNMILVIVGDVVVSEAETHLVDTFSAIVAGSSRPNCPEFGRLIHAGTESFYHFEPELGSTGVSIQALWDIEPENDSISMETRELTRYMGSMIVQYRLQKLKEKPDAPFTRAGHHYGDIADRIGYGSISAQTDSENWEKSVILLSKTLRQALEFGFSDGEVIRAKKEILTELDSSVLREKSEDSRRIAQKIIRHINGNRVYQSAEQEQELYTQIIGDISLADVNNGFRAIWDRDSRLISVTGDVRLGETAQGKILSVFQSSLHQPVAQYDKNVIERFPYLPIPEPVQSSYKVKYFPEIDVERVVFRNGLVLNLKTTDFAENNFQLTVSYGSGELSEPAAGMSMLAEDVINGSGSGKISKSALDAILAGTSIDLRFSVRESSYFWSGGGLKKDFEVLLQLLYTFLFDPGFRENVFDSVMSNTEQMYKKIERDISGGMHLQIQPFLASGNSHFGLPPWKTVSLIDYKQLSEWVQTIVPAEGMEISVVGDFNRKLVIDGIKKYFSGINLVKDVVPEPGRINFPRGKSLVSEIDTSIEKSLIVMTWPSDDFWQIRRTRRLHILASVFEDRIRKTIREKLGATYSPEVYSSNSRTYKGYGFLAAQMIVKPGDEKKIIDEILSLADELRSKGVTAEELARAKEPMITSIGDNLKENNYWLYSVLSQSARFPQKLEWPKTIMGDYSSITRDEISLLAKKYMDNAKAATAIVKPKKN